MWLRHHVQLGKMKEFTWGFGTESLLTFHFYALPQPFWKSSVAHRSNAVFEFLTKESEMHYFATPKSFDQTIEYLSAFHISWLQMKTKHLCFVDNSHKIGMKVSQFISLEFFQNKSQICELWNIFLVQKFWAEPWICSSLDWGPSN